MIAQLESLLVNMLEQGLLFGCLGLGVFITFRFFRFPDLTAEGSYPLGGAVAATLLVDGLAIPMILLGRAISRRRLHALDARGLDDIGMSERSRQRERARWCWQRVKLDDLP